MLKRHVAATGEKQQLVLLMECVGSVLACYDDAVPLFDL